MKDGTVVPHHVPPLRTPLKDVCVNERDSVRLVAEAVPHLVERVPRDIKNGQVGEPIGEKVVGEQRGSGPNVKNRVRR